jgi:hypothetical protein
MTWQRNGIPITRLGTNQNFPRICSDDAGGAFIAWEDDRESNTFVYVQRVNRNGDALWQVDGVKAANRPGLFISIAPDGKNGVLIGWNFIESVSKDDVALQCLDSLGNRVWGDSGVQVTNRPGNINNNDVVVISDQSGGAIVAWAEGTYPNYRVYAQRVDSSGSIRWQQNGVLMSDSSLDAYGVGISSDMKGGAIINWDYGDSGGAVQRISNTGQALWTPEGVQLVLSVTGGIRRNSSDMRGGAFVGSGRNIHHLDSLGNKLWGENGVAYYDTLGPTNSSQVHDGSQGIFNFAESYNLTGGPGGIAFIRVQWIDRTGKIRFGVKGIPVTPGLTEGYQFWPSATTDGRGGAIVCWSDYRTQYPVIYAARVNTTGIVTGVRNEGTLFPLTPRLEQNYPNPFNPTTHIDFTLSSTSFTSLKVYDVLGREIATLVDEVKRPGNYSATFDSSHFPSGVYFYRLTTSGYVLTRKMLLIR